MNVRAFAIISFTSVTGLVGVIIPATAMPKPETSSEGINLEVTPPHNTWENSNSNQAGKNDSSNDRIEVNSEKISSESNERSETFELERSEGSCQTNRTNQSSNGRTFEGSCDWDIRF